VAVLVGPPGAGKTTVGTLVAARLGLPFRDTDADIEERAGKPIPDIFVEDGEPAFRALEAACVAAALDTFGGVLALGGGAVMNGVTQARLAGHTVVYLSVGIADAAARVGLNRDRPLLLGNVRSRLKALLDERVPTYQKVATATVRTDGRSPDAVAGEVLEAIHACLRDTAGESL
jgi:shikimate kinase